MKKLMIIANCLLLLLLVCAGPATAQPTSARFTFKMTEEGGINTIHTFDRRPNGPCIMRLLGRSQAGKDDIGEVTTLYQTSSTARRIRWNAIDLPQVKKRINGKIPILHLMVSSRCGDDLIESNVFARRIRCGRVASEVVKTKKKRIGLKRWMRYLAHVIH